MKASLTVADLLAEVSLARGVVESGGTLPIVQHVLLDARDGRLHVAATDMDTSLRGSCPADVQAPGALTLPAKKLFDILRALPAGDVRLEALPDAWVSIESQPVSIKLAGLAAEDFPNLPKVDLAGGIEIPAPLLLDLITRTSFAVITDDARYYLAGALLVCDAAGAAMVATDGHRLSFARRAAKLTLAAGATTRMLIPRKVLGELSALLEGFEGAVTVTLQQHLVFVVGSRHLATKVIAGSFPAFEKVIEHKGSVRVVVYAADLARSIRRVTLLSSEKSRAVAVRLEEGRLLLRASSPDLGEASDSLPVDYTGKPIEVGFNAGYMLDFLAAAGTDQVEVELTDNETQGLLRPVFAPDADAADHRYVVMPMRL